MQNNQFLDDKVKYFDIDYNNIVTSELEYAYDYLLKKSEEEFDSKLNSELVKYNDFFTKGSSEKLLSLHSLISSLNMLTDNDVLREIEEHYSPIISSKFSEWSLNYTIYKKLVDYSNSIDFNSLNPTRKKMISKIIKDLKDSGVNLSDDKKNELSNLKSELSVLCIRFQNNITDAQGELSLKVKKEDLSGLSNRSISIANSLNEQNKFDTNYYILDESSGLLNDALKDCQSENIRRDIYMLKRELCCNGKYNNSDLIDKIYRTKQKIASLLGYENVAQRTLLDNMAKTPDNVLNFLKEMGNMALPHAKKESQMLRDYSMNNYNKPMDWWDQEFIANKYLDENYSINPEVIRLYFPYSHVISGLFKIIKDFFDVSFVEDLSKSKWDNDVRFFHVYESDVYIGGIYLDLFKRKGKSPGAWLNPISTYEKNELDSTKPFAILVCNINKNKEGISTFEIDDIVTLYHEMGHALHHLLSKVDEEFYSGFNNVEHDAIEIPSQLFENFVYYPSVLKSMSSHVETGEPICDNMVKKIINAKKFLGASLVLGMVRFSQMDMKLYNQNTEHPFFFEEEAFNDWKVVNDYDKQRKRMPVFSHIFGGGYSAGYYSYQWAEVFAADGFNYLTEHPIGSEVFKERILKYKEQILYSGGLESMMINYNNFKGSPPDKSCYLNLYI